MFDGNYECPECHGTGRTAAYMADFSEDCAKCNGSGRVDKLPEGRCPACGGKGAIPTQADTTDTCQVCCGTGSTDHVEIAAAYRRNQT